MSPNNYLGSRGGPASALGAGSRAREASRHHSRGRRQRASKLTMMMKPDLMLLQLPAVPGLQLRNLLIDRPVMLTRRDALLVGSSAWLIPAPPAMASGGATAGKTTSIPRAKVRYYGRMTAVVSAFNSLGQSIGTEAQRATALSFFSKDDPDSAASELKSAGSAGTTQRCTHPYY